MSDRSSKIISIVLYILLGVSAVLGVLFYAGPETSSSVQSVSSQPVYTQQFLIWAYILTGVAAVSSLVFPLIQAIIHPQNAKKGIIPIISILVIIGLAYYLASDQAMQITGTDLGSNPEAMKYAGTMIISVYLLAGVAILSILYSEIVNIFK